MKTPKELALLAARALSDKKGKEIRVMEIVELTTLADYFVLATGASNTQINALVDNVEKLLADGRVDFIFPADYREGMELDRTVRDILRKMTITDRLLEVNNRQLRSIGGDVLPNQVGLF